MPFIADVPIQVNELVLDNPRAKRWHDMVKAGDGYGAFLEWLSFQGVGEDPINSPGMARSAWDHILDTAEQFNKPGRFSAIIGYEWTSNVTGNNLHRNLLFRGDATRARQIIPYSNYDSSDPEDLWAWMAAYEEKTSDQVLAIPHNGNLSNGLMFAAETLTTNKPLDCDYAERRQRWGPVAEVIQPKGSGESHPFLSPIFLRTTSLQTSRF